jgi:hypothetical protein
MGPHPRSAPTRKKVFRDVKIISPSLRLSCSLSLLFIIVIEVVMTLPAECVEAEIIAS